MRLPLEAAAQSLQKVLVFFRPSEEEATIYVETIHSACSWMLGLQFEQVTLEIVKAMKPGRRPTAGQFLSEFNRLAEEKGWKSEETAKCSWCHDIGLVCVDIRNRVSGGERRVMKYCPKCKPGHELHPDWEEIVYGEEYNPHEAWLVRESKKLSDREAERILRQSASENITWPTAVVAVLTEKMARSETKREETELPI